MRRWFALGHELQVPDVLDDIILRFSNRGETAYAVAPAHGKSFVDIHSSGRVRDYACANRVYAFHAHGPGVPVAFLRSSVSHGFFFTVLFLTCSSRIYATLYLQEIMRVRT